jgi:SAM-dependent methyltransferase
MQIFWMRAFELSVEHESARKPHISVDMFSRPKKGLKIDCPLDLARRAQLIRMLEVGTGSGGTAQYLVRIRRCVARLTRSISLYTRTIFDGYHFQQVQNTQLPFADQFFDGVITNHVIDIVGDEKATRMHLHEMNRVLSSDGISYRAVPNRWMLFEPNYRLVFLSWLLRAWRTPCLRAMRNGEFMIANRCRRISWKFCSNIWGLNMKTYALIPCVLPSILSVQNHR